jgi:hypothetical protein
METSRLALAIQLPEDSAVTVPETVLVVRVVPVVLLAEQAVIRLPVSVVLATLHLSLALLPFTVVVEVAVAPPVEPAAQVAAAKAETTRSTTLLQEPSTAAEAAVVETFRTATVQLAVLALSLCDMPTTLMTFPALTSD